MLEVSGIVKIWQTVERSRALPEGRYQQHQHKYDPSDLLIPSIDCSTNGIFEIVIITFKGGFGLRD